MRRQVLAKEFGIKALHLTPVPGGVLEVGISEQTRLTGNTLEAALKMHCDCSGAGYAIYWSEVNGMLVVTGDYVTPERRRALTDQGLTTSFADASKFMALPTIGTSPVAMCVRHGH